MQDEHSLNLKEAGQFLRLSPHTVRAYARTRRMPHYRVGRRLLFRIADLEAFLERHRVAVRDEGHG